MHVDGNGADCVAAAVAVGGGSVCLPLFNTRRQEHCFHVALLIAIIITLYRPCGGLYASIFQLTEQLHWIYTWHVSTASIPHMGQEQTFLSQTFVTSLSHFGRCTEFTHNTLPHWALVVEYTSLPSPLILLTHWSEPLTRETLYFKAVALDFIKGAHFHFEQCVRLASELTFCN
jgi:hypothetical protein